MLTDRQIVLEIRFVNAAKGPQEVADCRPQALNGVDVDFSDPIPLVIPRPFLGPVTDRAVRAGNPSVALPFVGITARWAARVAMDMGLHQCSVRVLAPAQPTPACAPTNRANHRRPIILISAVPPALVGTASWRIDGIGMTLTFFPPHPGTSRPSPSRLPAVPPALTVYTHWLAPSAVRGVPCSDTPPTPQLTWDGSRPCRRPALTTRLGWGTTHSGSNTYFGQARSP